MVKIDLALAEISKATRNWFIFASNDHKFDHWLTKYKAISKMFLNGFKSSILCSKDSAVFVKY